MVSYVWINKSNRVNQEKNTFYNKQKYRFFTFNKRNK